MSGQFHAPAALAPAPISYEAAWAPEPVWKQWQKDRFAPPTGNRTPVVQQVAQSLHWLRYGLKNYECPWSIHLMELWTEDIIWRCHEIN
jgi:hypothetical protein